MIPINDNFSFALRQVVKHGGETSLSATQLFNALSDYGAFVGSPILKFVVKTLLMDGVWNEIIELYIEREFSENKANRIREVIKYKYGFSDSILNLIFHAIFNIDDWDNLNNPTDLPNVLHFDDVPIGGTSYQFRKKLIQKGYKWDEELQCLIGTFNDIPNCHIFFNESCSEYPVYFVKVNLPQSIKEEEAKILVKKLLVKEQSHTRVMIQNDDPYSEYKPIHCKRNHDSTYRIIFSNVSNYGIMIESCLYEPTTFSPNRLKIV